MKNKKTIYGVSVLAALIIGTLVSGSFYMLHYALIPDSKADANEKSAFNHIFKEYPYLKPWVDSLQQVQALRDTSIVNPDGVRLHAYYVKASQPTPKTAIIIHGYTDNAIRMLMIGQMFNHELGYNILLPDLQHHGESEGDAIQMGWKDRLDIMQWMDVANETFGSETFGSETFGSETQMVVYGISMGASTAMMVAGEKLPTYVKCFIEDCGYTSVWDSFSGEIKKEFSLPAFPLLYTSSWLCDLKYGWNFKEASALAQVSKCTLPFFFIHGGNDSYVPTWMVYKLYEAKPGEKELWIVPGAKHAASFRDNRQEYTHRVTGFLGKYIPI